MGPNKLHVAKTDSGIVVNFFAPHDFQSAEPVMAVINPAWIAILWEIGKGMLAWVGGQVLASVLGNTGPDLEKMFRELINDIRDVVREQLDEQDIRHAFDDINSFQTLMKEYLTSPDNRFDTLKGLVDNSIYPVGRLQTLQEAYPSAAFAYLAGSLFRLAVLQEYAKRENSAADFENFRNFAKQTAAIARTAQAKLPGLNDARITPVVSESVGSGMTHEADPRPIYIHICSYCVDGQKRSWSNRGVEVPWPVDAANNARNADLVRLRSEFQQKVMDPLNVSLQQIDELGAMQFVPQH